MKRNNLFNHFFRNGASMLYGMLLFSFLLGACSDEPIYKEPDPGQGVKMYLRIPAQTISQTRAGSTINDKYVDPTSVYVFVLSGNSDDANHRVLQVVNAIAGATDNLFYAKLSENSNAKHVYVVANAKETIENVGIDRLTGMSLGQLKTQLSKTATVTGSVISELISLQPMFGELPLPSGGITTETTIGTSGSPVALVRATSKITISNKAPDGNFTLLGANLVNAPKLGYIVSGQAATGERLKTGAEGDITKMISTPAEGNEKETILYSFESAKKEVESTFVIIETEYLGETHYYRLNLNNKETDYPLERNHHYMVDILRINKKGYSTVQEAIDNPAANIEYVVNVVDETGRNIVSTNGYYLAVSQTEFYYFLEAGDSFTDQEVATITHNAPQSVMSGSCTPSAGITISGGFSANTGGLQSFPLKVSMDQSVTEGTIMLELGDLKREIKVYRKTVDEKFHFGTIFKDFVKQGYISGQVDKADASWIKLAKKDKPTSEEQYASVEDKTGNIFVRVDAYLGDKNDQYRYGAIDLFREDEIGNARVLIKQKMFDVYTPTQSQALLRPFTYIATFHRWNQTGERIIRVDAKVAGQGSPANVNWRAHVISGDFIRLSKTRSTDQGVGHYNFYGAGDNTNYPTGESVEVLQVTDGDTEISSKVGGEPIYFRVGLTGKLASKTSQPRYGLIALIVNTGTGQTPITRYIYVRQGEEADYVMRPQDAVKAPSAVTMPNRPLAKKILPFNMTDKRGGKTSDLRGDNIVNAVLADYPSQGGYLYQATTKYGFWSDKLGHNTKDDQNYKESLSVIQFDPKTHETCPKGYRRPGETTLTTSTIATSEMRQSMWLYPQTGQIYETQNFIMGYMADGYYDRREMKNEVTFEGYGDGKVPETKALTAVESGSQIAYAGVLAFNPYSLASIFMPLAGYFWKFDLTDQGKSTGFWTQTREGGNYWNVDAGYLVPWDYSRTRFLADNYKHSGGHLASIRCIKDE